MENQRARFSTPPGSSSSIGHSHTCQLPEVRFVRLLLESMETAFFLANIYLESYGIPKIFEIVNQIIPTAYVYNTGYWVFYNKKNKECICVCHRFGLRCPHVRNDRHFINLNPLVENVKSYFKTPFFGKLFPIDITITVNPMLSDILRAFDAKISVTVQPIRYHNNRFEFVNRETVTFRIDTRYVITPEYYSGENIVVQFAPCPTNHFVYNSYFKSIERFRTFPIEVGYEMQIPRTHTVVASDLPKLSMVYTNETFAYATTQNLHPNAPEWKSDGAIIPPSEVWVCPDDNKFTVSFRSGSINLTTFASVFFCNQKIPPPVVKPESEEFPNVYGNAPAHIHCSCLRKGQVLSVSEYNFLGPSSFPSLSKPCSSNQTASRGNVREQSLRNHQRSHAKGFGDRCNNGTSSTSGESKWKKEIFEIKVTVNESLKVNNEY